MSFVSSVVCLVGIHPSKRRYILRDWEVKRILDCLKPTYHGVRESAIKAQGCTTGKRGQQILPGINHKLFEGLLSFVHLSEKMDFNPNKHLLAMIYVYLAGKDTVTDEVLGTILRGIKIFIFEEHLEGTLPELMDMVFSRMYKFGTISLELLTNQEHERVSVFQRMLIVKVGLYTSNIDLLSAGERIPQRILVDVLENTKSMGGNKPGIATWETVNGWKGHDFTPKIKLAELIVEARRLVSWNMRPTWYPERPHALCFEQTKWDEQTEWRILEPVDPPYRSSEHLLLDE